MTFAKSDELWRNYRQQLYLFILKRVNDSSVAEDIVQNVLMKVLGQRDSLRDEKKLWPWLYQITRNAIADHYRAHQEPSHLAEDLPAADEDTEESVGREFADCCIRPLVEELPAPYKEAVLLSELEGLTQKEVAIKLNISLSGAKSRVQRGRQLLKAALIQCCELEFDRQGQLMAYASQQPCGGCG